MIVTPDPLSASLIMTESSPFKVLRALYSFLSILVLVPVLGVGLMLEIWLQAVTTVGSLVAFVGLIAVGKTLQVSLLAN